MLALESLPRTSASIRTAKKGQIIAVAQALHHLAVLALLSKGLSPSILQLPGVSGTDTRKNKTSKSIKRSGNGVRPRPATLPCAKLQSTMLKSIYCGELRKRHAGEHVELAGWVHRRRDHGGLVFIDLRDSTGLVQLVFDPDEAADATKAVHDVRNEYVLYVRGEVSPRKFGTDNANLPTGEIEVRVRELEVLNASRTPPFPINEETEVEELLRLRYRYLDLRRERMAKNLRIRHKVTSYIRRHLSERGFVEIETPILTNSTPEGARDFLVPSRLQRGTFYALPQSPQQYKQLLMVAGFERYFQIARCLRDEDPRADRQFDFTQLDLEMSYATQEDVLQLFEELFTKLVAEVRPDMKIVSPFPRLTWHEAMRRYGSDKPDLRFGMELFDITDLAATSEFGVFKNAATSGGAVEGICVTGGEQFSRKEIDSLTTFVQGYGAKGLVSIALLGDPATLTAEEIRSPVAKYLSVDLVRKAAQRSGAKKGGLLLLVAGEGNKKALEPGSAARVKPALDGLRREVATRQQLADPLTLHYAFITEFPLVEWNDEDNRWEALHHLFTAPFEEDIPLFETDPGAIRSQAYDLICNGTELSSGSVRIHQRPMQEKVFRLLGISDEDAKSRFGHMLEAFEYGAPPHAGFAPGLDRVVAQLAGEDDIREVIAFPKTKTGAEPMTGAPSAVPQAQLDELGIRIIEEPEKKTD
jgi:aspartyl-tRNA synthetase